MTGRVRSAVLCAVLAAAGGCSNSPATDAGNDAGNPADTGAADVPAVDASHGDHDVVPEDAGESPDTGVTADTGVGTDGSTALVIHGCDTFEDRSGADATRTVTFANFQYTPKCMRVAPGQSVTFSGDFAVHQLRGGVAPSRASSDPAGSANNPIAATDSGSTATFTFPTAGTFPYYCLDHEGTGMYGVVRVE